MSNLLIGTILFHTFSIVLYYIIQVRKQLRDIEAKLKDQEEELDEQAGTIQMLEQVQTKRRKRFSLDCKKKT